MREIKARSSWLTGVLPPTRPARDRHPQYSRKSARCHATTLLGVTSTRKWFHPGQSHKREIQKNLCTLDSGRRGRFASRASSCWRRAKLSSMRSWRDRKNPMIQPMKFLRRGIIAGNLIAIPGSALNFHYMHERGFDERQLSAVSEVHAPQQA